MASHAKDFQDEIQSNTPQAVEQMQPEAIKLAMQILIGAVLEGSDELLRQMNSNERQASIQDVFYGQKIARESSKDLLRYALTGFLMDSSAGISRMLSRVEYISNEAAGLLFTIFRPITHSWFVRPARRRFNRLVGIGEGVVENWTNAGRNRENESRVIARQAAAMIIDDFIDYLSSNKEIRELVLEQGASLSGEAVAEIRERSANADEAAEQIFNIVLRRRKQMIEQSNRSADSATD
jgi:hypothetical protein